MAHHLRYSERLQGENVFRIVQSRPYGGRQTWSLEAVIKEGSSPLRWVTFRGCFYGRDGRADSPDRERPMSLTRLGSDVVQVEFISHFTKPKQGDLQARTEMLHLSNIPERILDGAGDVIHPAA